MEEALKLKCDLLARERARSEKNNEKAILTKEDRESHDLHFQSRKNHAHQNCHIQSKTCGKYVPWSGHSWQLNDKCGSKGSIWVSFQKTTMCMSSLCLVISKWKSGATPWIATKTRWWSGDRFHSAFYLLITLVGREAVRTQLDHWKQRGRGTLVTHSLPHRFRIRTCQSTLKSVKKAQFVS